MLTTPALPRTTIFLGLRRLSSVGDGRGQLAWPGQEDRAAGDAGDRRRGQRVGEVLAGGDVGDVDPGGERPLGEVGRGGVAVGAVPALDAAGGERLELALDLLLTTPSLPRTTILLGLSRASSSLMAVGRKVRRVSRTGLLVMPAIGAAESASGKFSPVAT